ncbi:MAG: 2-dehydropantoate 2-reductase N-terminal domain-containing protein, partial [Hydrogenovibrio sp.]
MARVLIAGCGDIGCRLGLNLSEKGHDVFGIRRDA